MNLTKLFRGRSLILLDFDGPVCAAFGPGGGAPIADDLRAFAASQGLPLDPRKAGDDPIGVLHLVATLRPDILLDADRRLRELERRAVRTAVPTTDADTFLHAAVESGRVVAIVSNNAGEAIEDYLAKHALTSFVTAVEGRPHQQPARTKPDPLALQLAAKRLGRTADETLMIGDSPSDAVASHALGIPCVGVANKSGKRVRLQAAGADTICDSMTELCAAMSAQ